MFNNRRVKRYTELAEARKAHLENTRGSRHVVEAEADDIPFGVKALEKGIEVEGIVISRSATPISNRSQQTLVGSDNESAKLQSSPMAHVQQIRPTSRPLVYQPSPYISLPAPLYHGISSSSSLASTSGTSMPTGAELHEDNVCRAYSDPLLQFCPPLSPDSQSGSSTPKSVSYSIFLKGQFLMSQSGHRRTRSPPINSPSSPSSRTHSRTLTPPDGVHAFTLPSANEDSIKESTRSNSTDSDDSDIPSRPRLLTAYSTPVVPSARETLTETAYGDLALLHTHRLSHAAEVGQLLPRANRISRVLPGGNFSSPGPFTSSAATDPVYALDIDVALRPAVPTPALTRHSLISPSVSHRRVSSSPVGETSKFVEQFWSEPEEQVTITGRNHES
jgi:hypothetical protein